MLNGTTQLIRVRLWTCLVGIKLASCGHTKLQYIFFFLSLSAENLADAKNDLQL
jgi:hypothetical protein